MTLFAYFVHENINYMRSLIIYVNESTFHLVLVSIIGIMWECAAACQNESSEL